MSNQEQQAHASSGDLDRSHLVNTFSLLMSASHELAPWVTHGLAYILKRIRQLPNDLDRGTNSTW